MKSSKATNLAIDRRQFESLNPKQITLSQSQTLKEWKDEFGNTPLHHACKYGNAALVKYLMDNMPTMYLVVNTHNQTPYNLIKDPALAELMLGYIT